MIRLLIKKNTFWVLILGLFVFPNISFACNNSIKPEMFVDTVDRNRASTYFSLYFPTEFKNEMFKGSTIELNDEQGEIGTFHIATTDITEKFKSLFEKFGNSKLISFRIARKYEKGLTLKLNYKEKAEGDRIPMCMSTFSYSVEELLKSYNKKKLKLDYVGPLLN